MRTPATIAEVIAGGNAQFLAKQYLSAAASFRAATDEATRLG